MIFNIDKETMPREKIREIQLSRLQDLCRRVYANVPFYRRSFDEKGIKPSDVQSLDDLKFLPFTLKQDMRNNYPYGLFVPMEMIQRIHASSGTTGKATVVGYTKRDIETWAECAARSLAAAGATANDIVQVSYGYGLFTGGLGAHYGAERLGATVIPMSGGSTKRQVQLMRDFGATVLCCTPSYALHLHDAGLEIGINIKDLPLRLGVFGAEPWTEEMRRESRTSSASPQRTFTACPKSWAPAFPSPAPKSNMVCTSGKTISFPRSSTPSPAKSCPKAAPASWSSPR